MLLLSVHLEHEDIKACEGMPLQAGSSQPGSKDVQAGRCRPFQAPSTAAWEPALPRAAGVGRHGQLATTSLRSCEARSGVHAGSGCSLPGKLPLPDNESQSIMQVKTHRVHAWARFQTGLQLHGYMLDLGAAFARSILWTLRQGGRPPHGGTVERTVLAKAASRSSVCMG